MEIYKFLCIIKAIDEAVHTDFWKYANRFDPLRKIRDMNICF